MTALKFERVNYTATETGREIRRALRDAFPGVKFSLRGSRGTGYGWFSLSWADGPTTRRVDELTNGFRSSYFDGMDDSTHQIPATMYADDDGVIREHDYTCHGVNSTRGYTDAATAWATSYMDAHGGPATFTADYWPSPDVAVWRILQGIDLCGVDWSSVPDPATDRGNGRHIATTYCLETGGSFYDWHEPRHAARV